MKHTQIYRIQPIRKGAHQRLSFRCLGRRSPRRRSLALLFNHPRRKVILLWENGARVRLGLRVNPTPILFDYPRRKVILL